MLLTAPKYFNLKETKKGTVLVNRGTLQKEEISEKYGNRQFYFMDKEDGTLKCLSGGQLAYIIDTHSLDASKEVKIVYDGTEKLTTGKYAGKESHQYLVELIAVDDTVAPTTTQEVNHSDPDTLE